MEETRERERAGMQIRIENGRIMGWGIQKGIPERIGQKEKIGLERTGEAQ